MGTKGEDMGEFKKIGSSTEDRYKPKKKVALTGSDHFLRSNAFSSRHFASQKALSEGLNGSGIRTNLLKKAEDLAKVPVETKNRHNLTGPIGDWIKSVNSAIGSGNEGLMKDLLSKAAQFEGYF